MKFLILMPLLVLLTADISCNDSILSKFHQNTYKLKDFRANTVSYNKKYVNYFDCISYKYNRTTSAINCTGNLKIPMGDEIEVLVQAYKFLSNEYRRIAVRFQVNAKKAFDSNALGIKRIKSCGNITDVNFKKNIIYHFCNYVIDETRLPPFVPSGRYKGDAILLYLNEEIAVVNLFAEIYTPIAYPKY